jgi:hypothetical protein
VLCRKGAHHCVGHLGEIGEMHVLRWCVSVWVFEQWWWNAKNSTQRSELDDQGALQRLPVEDGAAVRSKLR